jgi:hypothetical protein
MKISIYAPYAKERFSVTNPELIETATFPDAMSENMRF